LFLPRFRWLAAISLCVCTSARCSFGQDDKAPAATNLKATVALQEKIERTLEANLKHRMLSTERNGAWQVIHGAVAYGEQLPLETEGKPVLAIDYLFQGGTIDGWSISVGPALPSTQRPGVIAKVEPGSYIGQGHPDQWLGYFSQIPLDLNRKILVDGQTLSLIDWARQAQWDVPNNSVGEYSWTLIALTNFFPNEPEWKCADGNVWSIDHLAKFEAKQDLAESACGGMHRLMGLAHALRFLQRNDQVLRDGGKAAKQVVENAIKSARSFQNSDGSFSTNYTSRGGNSGDLSVCISVTGHTLEFLAYALEKNELQDPWMEKAVSRLCDMLKATEKIDAECGGTYHAIAGLKLYHSRRYGNQTNSATAQR
jgi:hypothetical protein